MIQSVGEQVPDGDISKVVFYLVKEVGLSHEEIFGSTKYVNFVEEVGRDGILGRRLDYVLGKKKVESTEKVSTKGMSLKAFAAYMDLFEEHQEEKEKEQKKAQTRQNLKNKTLG